MLTKTIDEVFSSLGCKQEVYRQLEAKYGISRQAVAENTKAFTDALGDMFGETAHILEIKIMGLLHSEASGFKYYPCKEELCFSGYLENLKKFLS